jgi:CRISPR-associated protein Csb2
VEATVDVAHVVLAALNETARTMFGDNRLPADLHLDGPGGRDPDGRERHTHAFVLPEDLDLDGVLDHVAVAMNPTVGGEGFTRRGLALLAACPGFWLGRTDARLHPAGLGASCPLGLDQPAAEWFSLTPFLPALERGEPATQLVQSLRRMGLPAPTRIERVAVATAPAGREIPAIAFAPGGPARRRWDRKAAFGAHRKDMAYWRVDFPAPVAGPVMVGGLSHFGLGRFAPAPDG